MQDQLSIDHFDAIAERYAGSIRTLAPLYAAVREELDAVVKNKDVLDVGNGGLFAYDRTLAASVTALDLSAEMLKRLPPDVRRIQADARGMAGCAEESFDVVLFSLSLHHVAAKTAEATDKGVAEALASAWRVLRPGGALIVYEPVLGESLFALETVLFRPVRTLLALAGVPMVYLRSRSSLKRLIGRACTVTVAPVSGWTDPLGGTFPGLLMIPAAMHPTRFELFRAEKPVG